MVTIKTEGEALDLPAGFSIAIEDSNPIFNDRGSQSIPATVPATRRNCRLLKAPFRIDTDTDPNLPERKAVVSDGPYTRSGIMNITEAGKREGITFNIGFDNSTAYSKWRSRKLSELDNLPVYRPQDQQAGEPMEWLLDELHNIYKFANPKTQDFAVFPLAVNNESSGTDKDMKTYWEVLNLTGDRGLEQPTSVKRLIDGVMTDVTIPTGYMVTPFLRVWRVLELIFNDFGVEIIENPFKTDIELARLVVLNNAADSTCRAKIKYSDLMPDCTVEEFMNALWVRFGLVYNIDHNNGTVRLELIRDIINSRGSRDISALATGPEKITYSERQYVKLSAATSIEGAAPSHERFEDFSRGLDMGSVRLGIHVSEWQNKGTAAEPKWDGDVAFDYYDPWEDYDPGDDPDMDSPDSDDGPELAAQRSAADPASETPSNTANTSFLAREFVTGTWYRLDATNGKVRASSSGFFNWDPQPDGYTAFELSSNDEFVPVVRVNTVGTGTGHSFNDKCPAYLFGARHYHTYIKGSEETDKSGDTTPLSFMFAYTRDNKTIGRLNPEGDDGLPVTLDDGSKPTLSLLFQFRDGLFARFWADFDEILRHGNRTVEVNTRINRLTLPIINVIDVLRFKGIRCLIDSMSYSLPSGKYISVDMKLRTLQPQGNYDIVKEQNIPVFAAGTRHLEWRLLTENYNSGLNNYDARYKAAQNFIDSYGYYPHGTEGDYWYVGAESAVFVSMSRVLPTWDTDPTLPEPTDIHTKLTRKYKTRLVYDIYEIHDMSTDGAHDDYELDELPIEQAEVIVDYSVVIAPVWVHD